MQARLPTLILVVIASLALTLSACDDGGGSQSDDTLDQMGDTPDGVDDDTPVNQQAVSGSRLKARWTTPEDGPAVFAGFYDSEMDVNCEFRRAMDGELRCLPPVDRRQSWSRAFLDAGCTDPFLVDRRLRWTIDGCVADPFYVSENIEMCPTRYQVENVGDEFTPPETIHFSEQDMCLEGGLSSDNTTYELTGEVDAADWVMGTWRQGEADGPVVPRFIDGEDGSSLYAGLYDTNLEHACSFRQAADGEIRCLPTGLTEWGLVWEDLFTEDSDCTSYLAGQTQALCVGEYGGRYDDRGSCNPKFSVHEVLDPYEGELYRGRDGTCEPVGQMADGGYYLTGPEIAADSFATIESLDPVGDTRLQGTRSLVEGDINLGSGWYDTERDEGCGFRLMSDGTMRCTTIGISHDSHYADAECTQRLYRHFTQCDTEPRPYVMWRDPSTCPSQFHLYERGPLHEGTVYEKFTQDGECTESASGSTLELYTEGTELMPDEFVAGTEVIDE